MGVADARTTDAETESLSPNRRRFTVDEYHRMIDTGILGEDEHVELLEGEILEMSPQSERHMRVLTKLNRLFVRALGEEYTVRPQGPLTFAESEPEPDLAIVRAQDAASLDAHPSTALLVVEVASSSARHDRELESRVYAKAGIAEYWVVLVERRSVEVFREPDPERGPYRRLVKVAEGDTLAAEGFAAPEIAVSDLFD